MWALPGKCSFASCRDVILCVFLFFITVVLYGVDLDTAMVHVLYETHFSDVLEKVVWVR